jgi:hypothetical protein
LTPILSRLVLLPLIALLAACGGAAAPSPTPNVLPTQTTAPTDAPPTDTPATEEASTDAAVTEEAATEEAVSNQDDTPDAGSDAAISPAYVQFTLQVSGAETVTAQGVARVASMPAAELQSIMFNVPDTEFTGFLQLPAPAEPGSYDLEGSTFGEVIAQVSTSFEPTGSFREDVSGTVTVESGEPLTGSVEFTSANEDGDTVTVNGQFEEMVYDAAMTVSGDIEMTIPPGSAQLVNEFGEYILSISSVDLDGRLASADNFVDVKFYMPPTIEPGDYAIISSANTQQPGEVGVMIIAVGETVASYDTNIDGTLTLTETGDRLTGSFTLSAESADGGRLQAEGSFEAVPLFEAQLTEGES